MTSPRKTCPGGDELSRIMCVCAAFRELYCRAVNPARHLMLWLPEVRRAPGLFRAFRARMMELLHEASCPSCLSA